MDTTAPDVCFIERIPNELLQRTFKFIQFDRPRWFQDNDENRLYLRLAMVLRSVSRRFRAVANENSWWFQSQYLHLDGLLRWNDYDDSPNLEIASDFYRDLFSDKHLCERLNRRNTWSFSTLELLQAVLSNFPSMLVNVRGIEFQYGIGPRIDAGLNLLYSAENITELRFTDVEGPLNLTAISERFPCLSHLAITALATYGSLRQLSGLVGYEIDFFGRPIGSNLVPITSATTLKTFEIKESYYCPQAYPNALVELKQFDSLENLSVRIVDDDFDVEFFMSAWKAVPLKSFKASMSLDIPTLLPSYLTDFKTLQTLELNVDVLQYLEVEECFSQCSSLIRIIPLSLSDLRSLTLSMPLDLAWVKSFGLLQKLERLVWRSEPRYYRHDFCKDMEDYERFKKWPAIFFEKLFRTFRKPPRIIVTVD